MGSADPLQQKLESKGIKNQNQGSQKFDDRQSPVSEREHSTRPKNHQTEQVYTTAKSSCTYQMNEDSPYYIHILLDSCQFHFPISTQMTRSTEKISKPPCNHRKVHQNAYCKCSLLYLHTGSCLWATIINSFQYKNRPAYADDFHVSLPFLRHSRPVLESSLDDHDVSASFHFSTPVLPRPLTTQYFFKLKSIF